MVWEFLQLPNVSQVEAKEAFKLVQNKNNYKIKKLYAKIVDDEVRKEFDCKKRKDLLAITDAKCLRFAFSLYKTRSLNRFEREQLAKRDLSGWQKKLLVLQNEPYSFKRYRTYSPSLVVSYLLTVPKKDFYKNFNKTLSMDDVAFLQKASNFHRFVMYVVTNYDLNELQRSFFGIDEKKLSFETTFYLALNALRNGNEKEAARLLRASEKKARHQRNIDKVYFWLYQATHDRSYLETMLLSMSINIYTLYAHETMQADVENYFYELLTNGEHSPYDLRNPFDWEKIIQEIRATKPNELFKLAKKYRYDDTLAVQRFIVEKAFRYKAHGYITPYEKYLKGFTNDEKALVYAIMRQESDYIPSSISRSFALGLMQLMPFLVKNIAKKQNENIKRFDEMFQPRKNLKYANIHLQWLKKLLDDNPLYIAYAYNGGYGFFTRYKAGGRFGKGVYEPFMSMEMMQNAQSREYGKRVLANYVMYKKIYNEPFSIVAFFQTLR